jgi:DNA repair exonuclease SbcCD ATPase subunit
MRLIIDNFRCYHGIHTFEFVEDGITLISGHSGSGKTSILMALHFVITGNCPPKVVADGCDSCRVTLEMNECTITRTRRPNRIVVKEKETNLHVEDDIAQQYIDRYFGKYFDITSYIQQQYQKTFLYQSPAEKLDILEKLCFDDVTIQPEELKKNCTAHMKQLSQQHITLKSRYNTLSEQYAQYGELTLPQPIQYPCETGYRTLLLQLETIKQDEQQYYLQLSNREKREMYQRSIQDLTEQYSKYPATRYTEKQMNEHIFYLKEIQRLTQQPVWIKHSKEDCECMISDYKRDISYHKEYKQILQYIKTQTIFEEEIRVLKERQIAFENLSEGIYECPSCKVRLSLNNKRLEQTDQDESKVSTIEKKQIIDQLKVQIEQLQPKIRSLEHYRTRKSELESLIDLEETITSLEEDYKWISDYYESNRAIDAQNKMNETRKQNLTHQLISDYSIEQSIAELEHIRQQTQLSDKIQYTRQQLESIPVLEHSMDIDQINQTRKSLEEKIQAYHHLVHQYELYRLQLDQYEKWKTLEQEIENVTRELVITERKMTAMTELRQHILKAESEIIDQKTREISELVNMYCSQIFNEPITIELKTTKKTSTQVDKVQVQLEVYYKNMKCDASLLSGGEQARLNLAFVLAFAYVFHAKLLLLDECTSNLDQELIHTVIEQIEQVGIPKVILIAHQIVEGNFKQIIHTCYNKSYNINKTQTS